MGCEGKCQSSSLQEKTLYTYTLRLGQSKISILYKIKKIKKEAQPNTQISHLFYVPYYYYYYYYQRQVQVTPGVTLKSYTFFKPLDLSRSNGKKKTLINANILIRISLIIHHLLYFISISRPKKSIIFDSLSLHFSLYLFLLHRCSTSMDRLLVEGCELMVSHPCKRRELMVSHPCKSYIQKRKIFDERTFQHEPAIAANHKRKKA